MAEKPYKNSELSSKSPFSGAADIRSTGNEIESASLDAENALVKEIEQEGKTEEVAIARAQAIRTLG